MSLYRLELRELRSRYDNVMAGIFFIINVPKKDYEKQLKLKNIPNLNFEKGNIKNTSELKINQKCTTNPNNTVQESVTSNSKDYSHQSDKSVGTGVKEQSKERSLVWDEIKQILKLNRNKFKISHPVRIIDVSETFNRGTPLETILSEIISRFDIKNAAWNSTRGDKFWQVTFSLESGELSEDLLQILKTLGLGSYYQSSVCLLPCALYYKTDKQIESEIDETVRARGEKSWSQFSSSVRARKNLAQVLHNVRVSGTLTFDWVFMLVVAASISAIGLIQNSTAVLVASMLMSPLMAPITAGTLGTVVRDYSLQRMGLRNELLGLFIVVAVGFLVGLTTCILDEIYGVVGDKWPTSEMLSRCHTTSLWLGVLKAIPSGAGCALAILGGYTAPLFGVAISASLLPPAVNTGIFCSMSFMRFLMNTEKRNWLIVDPQELAQLGAMSFCLTLLNIGGLFLAEVIVFKVKEVSPLERKDTTWWRHHNKRPHVTKQQNKDESLNWDAYTQWCSNSFDRNPDSTTEKENENKEPCKNTETLTVRPRPSVLQRFSVQHSETLCNRVQQDENYIPLNANLNKDLQTQIETLSKATQKINTDDTMINAADSNRKELHRYYNFAYDNEEPRHIEAPIIVPSLTITVDSNSYGVSSDKFNTV